MSLEQRLRRAEHVLTRLADGELDVCLETGVFDDEAITNLEMGINFLIMDLRSTAELNREHKAALAAKQSELEAQLATIAKQAEAINKLSTPILEVWSDVLVLPLIGVLDTTRSSEVTEALLTKIVAVQARCVIIDVTGVALVDTGTADSLIRIVRSVSLLGARAVLTGLGPAVSRTLVDLGFDLSAIRTLRSLKQGLEDCIAFLNASAGFKA